MKKKKNPFSFFFLFQSSTYVENLGQTWKKEAILQV